MSVAGDRVERRLAAILAADVAGYSRLMGIDEEGTLRALTAHRRELIDPKILEHHGRLVKTTGDGALVEFASVVDAVRCAVEVQRGMAERNGSVPADARVEFRIGINVGDIIIQGDDIFGDGVNVAARLEGLALPGGICVSGIVHDQVQDKLSFAFDEMGEQHVKNIARPVDVYRVKLNGEIRPASSPSLRAGTRPSRAILAIAGAIVLALIAAGGAWLASRPSAPSVNFNLAKARLAAERNSIPLPSEIAVAPFGQVPANLAGYLGAWGGDDQWGRIGRHAMLIVTSVQGSGAATAIYAEGPPAPTSFAQSGPRYVLVNGKIDDDGFKFNLGTSKLSFVASAGNVIYGRSVLADGRSSQVILSRID